MPTNYILRQLDEPFIMFSFCQRPTNWILELEPELEPEPEPELELENRNRNRNLELGNDDLLGLSSSVWDQGAIDENVIFFS